MVIGSYEVLLGATRWIGKAVVVQYGSKMRHRIFVWVKVRLQVSLRGDKFSGGHENRGDACTWRSDSGLYTPNVLLTATLCLLCPLAKSRHPRLTTLRNIDATHHSRYAIAMRQPCGPTVSRATRIDGERREEIRAEVCNSGKSQTK